MSSSMDWDTPYTDVSFSHQWYPGTCYCTRRSSSEWQCIPYLFIVPAECSKTRCHPSLVQFVYISTFSSTTQICFHTVIHCKATCITYIIGHVVLSKEWIIHKTSQQKNYPSFFWIDYDYKQATSAFNLKGSNSTAAKDKTLIKCQECNHQCKQVDWSRNTPNETATAMHKHSGCC
jgi:hypothetical protein